jgi:hypothetical protein
VDSDDEPHTVDTSTSPPTLEIVTVLPNRERAAVAPSAGLPISRSSSFHQRQRSIS